MATTTKKIYEAPTAIMIELAHQGVICASPDASYTGFGNEDDWTI